MPMEHLRENGDLCQGYYCNTCGQPCGMHGHFNQIGCVVGGLMYGVSISGGNAKPWRTSQD